MHSVSMLNINIFAKNVFNFSTLRPTKLIVIIVNVLFIGLDLFKYNCVKNKQQKMFSKWNSF